MTKTQEILQAALEAQGYEGRLEELRASVRLIQVRSPAAEGTSGAGPDFAAAGLAVLREEVHDGLRSVVLRGTPAAWQAFDGWDVETCALSVENIFVALVGKGAIVA